MGNKSLLDRIASLEAVTGPRVGGVVTVPFSLVPMTDEEYDAAIAAAIERAIASGRQGPFLIAPEPCTEEQWLERWEIAGPMIRDRITELSKAREVSHG